MRKLLIITVVLALALVSLNATAQTTISCGSPVKSFDDTAIVDSTAGTSYALYNNLLYVSWQTAYTVAPSAINISLEGSLDNSAWSAIDTSTSTSGELRNVSGAYRFIRAYVNSHTGGSGMTVTINCTRQTGGAGSGYSQIEDQDVALIKRGTVNFEGAGVTCADDTTKTTCTITSGGGGVDTANSPLANEFARFTDLDTIEGRTVAETKSDLSLNNVENTALSTWVGSTNIGTLGTITTGTWTGTDIALGRIAAASAESKLLGRGQGSGAGDFQELSLGAGLSLSGTTLSFASPGAGIIVDTDGAGSLAARTLTAGTGISVANGAGAAGNPTVGADTATTPQFSSGTASPPGTCTVGQTYLETDVPRSCECSATNTWVCGSGDVSLAGTPDYITISGQTITRGSVDLAADVTGDLPFANVAQASGASVLLGRGSAGGAGDFQEITLGSGLSMSGTALSASAGSSFDPGTTFELYEEFAGGELSADRIGENGLRHVGLSSGSPAYVASDTIHPGLFRLESSATDNSTAMITASGSGASFYNVYHSTLLNTYDWQIDAVLLMGSNSTAITSSSFWMGWTTSLSGTPDLQGNGFWIRRDTDLSDGAFVFQVCDGAGGTGCGAAGDDTNSTTITSTITPSAGTFYRFRIRFDPTGASSNPTLYWRVNDETEKTMCLSGCDDVISNFPGTGVGLGYFFVAYAARAASTVRSGDIDYLYIKVENIARY